MAYVLDFTLPNVPQLQIRGVLTRVLQLAALYAEREARLGALEAKDTGATARSIVSEVQGMTARVYSPLVYASVMETGRRPGAKMPPPAALEGWIARHNPDISPFVLARAIARRGTAGRFFFRRAVTRLETALPGLVAQAMREQA